MLICRLGAVRVSVFVCVFLAGAWAVPRVSGQDSPALSGPRVEDRAVPGMEKTFGAAMMSSPMVVRESIPMGRFLELARSMEGEDALTEAQQREAQQAITEWNQQVAAYYGVHLTELQAAQALLPENEARSVGGTIRSGTRALEQGWKLDPPDPELGAMVMSVEAMDSMMMGMEAAPDAQTAVLTSAADARALVARIRRGAPPAWEAQTKIWNLLNRSQQEVMEGLIREYREQERERREQREMQRVADREGVTPSMTLAERTRFLEEVARTGVIPDESLARLPEAFRERFEAIDAEDRQEATRALAQRLQMQSLPTAAASKPAPSLQELTVPDPE